MRVEPHLVRGLVGRAGAMKHPHAMGRLGSIRFVTTSGLALLLTRACTIGSTNTSEDASPPMEGAGRVAVVSQDPYLNANAFHRTQGEPDSLAFGSRVVSAFMTGYHEFPLGATNIGWAVSADEGRSWNGGFLPGTTTSATPSGPWTRTSDPSVAYDAKHDTWLIAGIGSRNLGDDPERPAHHVVFVSRSTDGARTFSEPVIVVAPDETQFFDKSWIVCDNGTMSPFLGQCYVEYHDDGHDNGLHMARSRDGGLTWGEADVPERTHVVNGHPNVLPDGTVVMPILAGIRCCGPALVAFVSEDGGLSYTGPSTKDAGPAFGEITMSQVGGDLFVNGDPPGIDAAVDAAGTVYVVWADCRFRDIDPDRSCVQNDVLMSTTGDGRHWTSGFRIPIDPRSSSVDHFRPAVAVDPTTSGASAHIAVLYYYYPDAECDVATCELSVGFASSTDGGSEWSHQRLAGPFNNAWFPPGDAGYRLGDYISVSFVDGAAVSVFTVANAGTCALGQRACSTWIASATVRP